MTEFSLANSFPQLRCVGMLKKHHVWLAFVCAHYELAGSNGWPSCKRMIVISKLR